MKQLLGKLCLKPTRKENPPFPGEAPRSAAACRRICDSDGADLRRARGPGRQQAAALRRRLRRGEMELDSNAQGLTVLERLALIMILFLLSGATLLAQTVRETPLAEEALTRMLARYREIDTLSARFTHRFGHNLEQEEQGFLLLKKPAKMYWEYEIPRKKIFVADGRRAFFYVPDDRQVFESELQLDTAETPLLFLFGNEDVRHTYRAEYEMIEPSLQASNLLLRLTPRVPRGEFTHVLLEIDPDSYLIVRLVVVEPVGNENHYLLREIQENIKLPDRHFRFKVPAGVERIRQAPSP